MNTTATVSKNGRAHTAKAPRPTCVIQYAPDGYETGKRLVVGRRVAGQYFLRALCRYGTGERIHCLAESADDFSKLAMQVEQFCRHAKEAVWLQPHELSRVNHGACVFRGDPAISPIAWSRRYHSSDAYSICGMTHTLCSVGVIDSLGELLIAPVEPWDAMVCTSQAARNVVESVIAEYGEYLRERLGGGAPNVRLQLPVIPLGVDCDALARPSDYTRRRKACRKRWKIQSKEVVLLFSGRLSFHAKANPYSLFAAAHHVAKQTGKKISVVLAGQFPNTSIQSAFQNAWMAMCPDQRLVCTREDSSQHWRDIWYGADVFVSLVDNIQETFGLTPLEAMAAGLPVVVSDWDGYRDTVRHGVDGFRVGTSMPVAGTGEEFIHRYASGRDNYDRYIGNASAFVGVDIGETVRALTQLVLNPQMRAQMGAAARQRAEQFDWRHVVSQYESLWQELNVRRLAEGQKAGRSAQSRTHPLRQDPYRVFAHYASHPLSDDHELTSAKFGNLETALNLDVLNLARRFLGTRDECEDVLSKLQGTTCSVREVLEGFPAERHTIMRRTLSWMHKAGLVTVIQQLRDSRRLSDHALHANRHEANGDVAGRRWFRDIGKRFSFHRSRQER